jgi:thiamine-phosphate pyrophosphorylase
MPDSELAARLSEARLYVVSADAAPEIQARLLCQAIDGGAGVVQLRNKSAAPADLFKTALLVGAYARVRGAIFIVNDHLSLAIESGADGVHLGQEDVAIGAARAEADISRWGGLMGRSTHDLEQALEAVRDGADYIGVGPVYTTPTKPGRPAVGLELLEAVAHAVSIPWFAIGGIDAGNLDDVLRAGATRAAVVRAVCEAPEPADAARALLARLQPLGATA